MKSLKMGSSIVPTVLIALAGQTICRNSNTGAAPPPAEVAEVMNQAVTDRDSLPPAEGSLWRFEGPRNLQAGCITGFGLAPHSGRINEIAVHPTNPQILYATGATGGAWKSTDAGITWASRSSGWPVQSATAVAIDPNHGNRVFVGTGDYKRLDHVPPFSGGVMRSLDGGLTWGQFGAGQMKEFTISRIVVDPANSQNVLAAAGRGGRLPGGQVFRSSDGGVSWAAVRDTLGTPLPEANWDDLELCGSQIFWASATRRRSLDFPDPNGASGLLYQSRDSGTTWSKVTVRTAAGFDLDAASSRPDVILLACAPGSSSVLLAVFENQAARIFITADSGVTWTERTSPLNYPVPVGNNPWAHCAFGVTRNYVYVGGVRMFRGTFVEGIGFLISPLPGPALHGDFQCVTLNPAETDGVFFGNDGGIYRHSAQANTTVSLSASLGVTQIYRMDVHKRHGGLIAIGTQDLGDSVSFFGNGNDADALRRPPSWALVLGGDGRSGAFQNDNSSRVYLANTTGSIVQYDGSRRTGFQSSGAPDAQGPLLYSDSALCYADRNFQVLLNPDSLPVTSSSVCANTATANWLVFPFIPGGPAPAAMQALSVCPGNSDVMYAGSVTGRLFYSEDAGSNWTELERTGLPAGPVWAIAPSAQSCHDVVIAVGYTGSGVRTGNNDFDPGPRLFRKADVLAAGAWTSMHGGSPPLPRAPIFAIIRHPADPASKWFVAGDVGVFRTDDGGLNWANATLPLGLPNTLARDMRLSADGNTLYAATFGRGVWSMDVSPPADSFGVRGWVTQGGRPVSGVTVQSTGPGRIWKVLKNTLTTGTVVTTAPIPVGASASISQAAASLIAGNAESVSLVTPAGTLLAMSAKSTSAFVTEFALTTASATALVGQSTRGNWSFRVVGRPFLRSRLTPSVHSGTLDFQFQGTVQDSTGPDGEYTLEFLTRGTHTISAPDANCGTFLTPRVCQRSVNLQTHATGVNFQVLSVGEFGLVPADAVVRVHEPLNYTFTWQVPEPLSWRDLETVELRIRDESETILSIVFDEANRQFSLIHPVTGEPGPAFAPGSPNTLQSSGAALDLENTEAVGSGPTGPSVTLNLALSFKPRAAGRTFVVEAGATDDFGNQDGFAPIGTLRVITE